MIWYRQNLRTGTAHIFLAPTGGGAICGTKSHEEGLTDATKEMRRGVGDMLCRYCAKLRDSRDLVPKRRPRGLGGRSYRQRTFAPKQLRTLVMHDRCNDDAGEHSVPRPRVRGDCEDGPRPCPWVGCRYHLYLEVNPRTGSIKLQFPDFDPWELAETCALDVADRGGYTLEETGELFNISRERVRQVQGVALRKVESQIPADTLRRYTKE